MDRAHLYSQPTFRSQKMQDPQAMTDRSKRFSAPICLWVYAFQRNPASWSAWYHNLSRNAFMSAPLCPCCLPQSSTPHRKAHSLSLMTLILTFRNNKAVKRAEMRQPSRIYNTQKEWRSRACRQIASPTPENEYLSMHVDLKKRIRPPCIRASALRTSR